MQLVLAFDSFFSCRQNHHDLLRRPDLTKDPSIDHCLLFRSLLLSFFALLFLPSLSGSILSFLYASLPRRFRSLSAALALLLTALALESLPAPLFFRAYGC